VARLRRAEADEIATAKFVERAQELMLIGEPALIFRDDRRAVAVRADPERIAPFAAAADIDGTRRHVCFTACYFFLNPISRVRRETGKKSVVRVHCGEGVGAAKLAVILAACRTWHHRNF